MDVNQRPLDGVNAPGAKRQTLSRVVCCCRMFGRRGGSLEGEVMDNAVSLVLEDTVFRYLAKSSEGIPPPISIEMDRR